MFFTGQDAEQLYGRVELGKGPLVNALFPLYFKVSLQPSIVPGRSAALLLHPGVETECLKDVEYYALWAGAVYIAWCSAWCFGCVGLPVGTFLRAT